MDVKSALAREMRGIEGFKVMWWVQVLPMQWLKGAYGRCRAQDLSLHTLSGFTARRFVPSAIFLGLVGGVLWTGDYQVPGTRFRWQSDVRESETKEVLHGVHSVRRVGGVD